MLFLSRLLNRNRVITTHQAVTQVGSLQSGIRWSANRATPSRLELCVAGSQEESCGRLRSRLWAQPATWLFGGAETLTFEPHPE